MEVHKLHTAELYVGDNVALRIKRPDGSVSLSGTLGSSPGVGSSVPRKAPAVRTSEHSLELEWAGFGKLTVEHSLVETGTNTGHMYKFDWQLEVTGMWTTLTDSFTLDGAHWYGGSQLRTNQWPLEKLNLRQMAFVAGDSFQSQFGGVQERYFLNSKGAAIFVEEDVPLFVEINHNNDKSLTLTSKWNSPYRNVHNRKLFFTYFILTGSDVRECHGHVMEHVFSKPSDVPDMRMLRHPVWSTWARYKTKIDHDTVLQFADEITSHGFSAAQIEIDDDWTPSYGDMEFDPKKFPDAKATIQALEEKGYRVTVWVHPFASPFSAASSQPYWCRSGVLPGVTTWWNGVAKILDVTNDDAVMWFSDAMNNLRLKYGVTSFKFDAGEVNYLPKFCRTKVPLENPNTYTKKYAEMCYSIDPELRALEVRVGSRTQHLPVWVRIMDKDSNWGWDNGLRTLIPHVLTFSIIGYPFILPDMIGGNAYPHPAFPEKELFIRWLQVNVFLPCLQFSIAPWQYDEEVVKISRKMTRLHEDHADLLEELARESTRSGAPIIRPVWWVAPQDEEALKIDSEFLVGDDLLVAPILEKGAMSRDVYLPSGRWCAESGQKAREIIEGGTWIKNFPAKLDELPWFTRVKEGSTENTAKNTAESSDKNATENATEKSLENTEENTTENSAENTTENSAEITEENTTENSAENTNENTTENSAEITEENTTGNSAENTEENTTENSAQSLDAQVDETSEINPTEVVEA